ncbi:MAG: hypothetical protein H7Y33_03645 [Cytophagales bacterium]|nr:hypothetical protein [Rhizobacter sp.]
MNYVNGLRAGMVLAVVLAAGNAASQNNAPVPKPTPKVGDVLEFANLYVTVPCKRWEVKEVNKDGMQISQCGGNVAYFDVASGNLVRIVTKEGDKLVQFSPRGTSIDFPLSVGKSWTANYDGYTNDDGASWNAKTKCAVHSAEKIKVAAGEFDTLRIDCEDAWSSGPFNGVSKTTSWYAPKVGTVVKSSNPEAAKWNYELTSFQSK